MLAPPRRCLQRVLDFMGQHVGHCDSPFRAIFRSASPALSRTPRFPGDGEIAYRDRCRRIDRPSARCSPGRCMLGRLVAGADHHVLMKHWRLSWRVYAWPCCMANRSACRYIQAQRSKCGQKPFTRGAARTVTVNFLGPRVCNRAGFHRPSIKIGRQQRCRSQRRPGQSPPGAGGCSATSHAAACCAWVAKAGHADQTHLGQRPGDARPIGCWWRSVNPTPARGGGQRHGRRDYQPRCFARDAQAQVAAYRTTHLFVNAPAGQRGQRRALRPQGARACPKIGASWRSAPEKPGLCPAPPRPTHTRRRRAL